jgi:hypothetical protein
MTSIAEARRKGFGVKLVKPAPVPEPVVVNVTVDLPEMQTQGVEITQNQEVAQAVIAAANKIPARAVVDSCDLEHEWVRGMQR